MTLGLAGMTFGLAGVFFGLAGLFFGILAWSQICCLKKEFKDLKQNLEDSRVLKAQTESERAKA
jgi:amino acid transporter